jgi:hypothetical protein
MSISTFRKSRAKIVPPYQHFTNVLERLSQIVTHFRKSKVKKIYINIFFIFSNYLIIYIYLDPHLLLEKVEQKFDSTFLLR